MRKGCGSSDFEGAGRRRLLLLLFAAALMGCFLTAGVFAVPALAQKKPPPATLDLNSATAKQLEELPGVGPVTAKAIVDFRQKAGPFKRVEDLLVIRGISERKLKEIRPYITIKPPGKPAKPAKP
jgi:competence ComEA-like helix-hairpin-helix protein